MKKLYLLLSFILLAIFMPSVMPNAVVFASEKVNLAEGAKSALLYDKRSGSIVFEKNMDKHLPIASMTKLASLMLIFDAMDRGEFDESTLIRVSHHSAKTEGSSAFLDEGSDYKAGDLIMSVIVCSANDSTVALAEKVAGTEDEFVKRMNTKVKEMGLKDTSFMNCTGLPAIDHYSSAHDIAKIYEKICDNKIYKKYSTIWMTELVHPSGRKTDIVNTNRLIRTYEGCDSGKTGFTSDAGYCLSASATRGVMRLIGVVIGEKDSKTRFNEMADMFNYGFSNYENKVVLSKDQPLGEREVVSSKQKVVKFYPEHDLVKFIRKGEDIKYSLEYRFEKLKAPLKSGEVIGKLFVLDDKNIVTDEMPLVVREDVQKIKLKDILVKIFKKI